MRRLLVLLLLGCSPSPLSPDGGAAGNGGSGGGGTAGAGGSTGGGGATAGGSGGGSAGGSAEPSCSASNRLRASGFDNGLTGSGFVSTPGGVTPTTGRSGGALRITYSMSDYSAAIETSFPETAHIYVTYWYRTDPGFDPCENDNTGSGMKWFTLWRETAARQTWGAGCLTFPTPTFSTHDNSSPDQPNPPTVAAGTAGPADAWSRGNDGGWHRYSIEALTGDQGFERAWLDGALLFDSAGKGWHRSDAGFVLTKFPSDKVAAPLTTHYVDIDDFDSCRL